MNKLPSYTIPKEVLRVTAALQKHGFEAYLIGGCTRDMLRGVDPKDWDVTTNATPEEIQKLFEHTFYENDFGTVGVVDENASAPSLETIEVTTYRLEADYSDKRRPDTVAFSTNLSDDLQRRDFTMNAIAISIPEGSDNLSQGEIVDPYEGFQDVEDGIIRAVGEPKERFGEDALRMMRAVRLSSELDFSIDADTERAIVENASLLTHIAKERIRDEFQRIVMSPEPMKGLFMLQKLGLLRVFASVLEEGIGIDQNQAHSFGVWEHSLRTLQAAADKGWDLEIRLAALLHDCGKPKSRRWSEEKNDWTFYGHDVVGARITRKLLSDLRFPKKLVDTVEKLVRWHMFFSDPEIVTLSAVRRMIQNVGEERIWDLMNLRVCDRIGTGRPKEKPYRYRKYAAMIDEALRDPISPKQLKIDGEKIMQTTGEKPGPRIGAILHALLEEVLDDPTKNTQEYLEKRAGELAALSEKELSDLGESGKGAREKAEEKEVEKIRGKHWVK